MSKLINKTITITGPFAILFFGLYLVFTFAMYGIGWRLGQFCWETLVRVF